MTKQIIHRETLDPYTLRLIKRSNEDTQRMIDFVIDADARELNMASGNIDEMYFQKLGEMDRLFR